MSNEREEQLLRGFYGASENLKINNRNEKQGQKF
jgi:hypothetical protein